MINTDILFAETSNYELYELYQNYLSGCEKGLRPQMFDPYADTIRKETNNCIDLHGAYKMAERAYFEEIARRFFSSYEETKTEDPFIIPSEARTIILAKCNEMEAMGYDYLSDSDIMDILEECRRKNIPASRKMLEQIGLG